MVKTFYNLSLEAQIIIRERFGRYNIDGQYAFDHGDIFSDEVKNMSSNDIITFLEHKDISHIYPRSQYPFLEGDINNIFLEDSMVNRIRGAEIVTPYEQQVAWNDQVYDTIDLDVNEDGIIDLTGLEFDLYYDDYYSFNSYFLDTADLFSW
tara:strand:- start:570 stop:1022 length:453 start_codon:yes stop_codon:yes gene_type:complete